MLPLEVIYLEHDTERVPASPWDLKMQKKAAEAHDSAYSSCSSPQTPTGRIRTRSIVFNGGHDIWDRVWHEPWALRPRGTHEKWAHAPYEVNEEADEKGEEVEEEEEEDADASRESHVVLSKIVVGPPVVPDHFSFESHTTGRPFLSNKNLQVRKRHKTKSLHEDRTKNRNRKPSREPFRISTQRHCSSTDIQCKRYIVKYSCTFELWIRFDKDETTGISSIIRNGENSTNVYRNLLYVFLLLRI